MEDITKYIGLVHRWQGIGKYADCVSLCRKFYSDHSWPEDFTDGKLINEEEYKHQPYRLLKYLMKAFDKTTDVSRLRHGDIVCLKIYGDLHLGIYLEYGKLLCMQVPVVTEYSKSTVYRRQWWEQFFLCGFLRKGD